MLGCGGMLAKHCDDAAIVILRDTGDAGAGQTKTAQRLLGEPAVTQFGLPAGHLGDDVDRIVGLLVDVVAELRPTEVYLPYPLAHHDHLVAFEAGMRATHNPAPCVDRPQISVLLYHVDAAPAANYPADIRWSVCESLTEDHIDRKVAAAIAYRSPFARCLKSRAEDVGSRHDLPWAEQFALIRAARPVEHPAATSAQSDLALVLR